MPRDDGRVAALIDRLGHHADVVALLGDHYWLRRNLGRIPPPPTCATDQRGVRFRLPLTAKHAQSKIWPDATMLAGTACDAGLRWHSALSHSRKNRGDMGTDDVRGRVNDLAESTWAFAVVCASAESGLLGGLASPRRVEEAAETAGMPVEIAARVLDVLVALGFAGRSGDTYQSVDGLQPTLTDEGIEQLLAELRTTFQQSRDLVDRAKRRTLTAGWIHTDPEILHAQGASGRAGARALAEQAVPRLSGLAGRLSAPSASFLDVGVGVGVIAIEMCRTYPTLRVVGLEPAEAPRREALANIEAAGYSDRIEIRDQRVEALTDVEAFDLAYLPQVFLPEDAFVQGLATVWRALRPGGWLTLPAISVPGSDFRAALSRLRDTLWGGGARFPEQVAEAVMRSGFTDVEVRSVGGTMHAVVARRPA
jgi:predicted O-methyltransferase YrrM